MAELNENIQSGFQKYRRFIVKVLLFSLLLVVLDFVVGSVIRHYFDQQKFGRLYRASYVIKETKADILIFGSSRAAFQYIPSIFEKRLHKSCYNAGSVAQYLIFNYAVFRSTIKRYAPKVVILDLAPGEFQYSADEYARLSLLLPFYKDSPEIRPILEARSKYEKYKFLSSCYPFNSLLVLIASGNSDAFGKARPNDNGYSPLVGKSWDKPIEEYSVDKEAITPYKIDLLNKFITLCEKSKTKLYIVCSPTFMAHIKKDPSMHIWESIAKKRKVTCFNYSEDTTFTKPVGLFYDTMHLNGEGATIFTNKLIDRMLLEMGRGDNPSIEDDFGVMDKK